MEREWKLSDKFYHILILVVAFHFLFLISKFGFKINTITSNPTKAINLKLIEDVSHQIKNKKQIVQSEDSDNLSDNKKATFLSDKTRTFERETISKNNDVFKEASKGNATVNSLAQKNNSNKKIENLKFSDLGIGGEIQTTNNLKTASSEKIKGENVDRKKDFSTSSTNDFVEEVKLGDFTRLNTTEYKHYGFFFRIRQKLEQYWGESIREKANNLYRAGRRIPASENLITSLQITLNDKGEIIKIKILSTSGVRDLDEAAVNSFNKAGPFPNPPKDLLVNGKAVIEWGFVVKS